MQPPIVESFLERRDIQQNDTQWNDIYLYNTIWKNKTQQGSL